MSIRDAVEALSRIEKGNEDKRRAEASESVLSFGRQMQDFMDTDVWVKYLKPELEARKDEALRELMDVRKGDAEWPNNLVRAQEKALGCDYIIGLIERPIKYMERIMKEEENA